MAKEIIQCTYKGQPVRVITCLPPEEADALRNRWPDGVVVLERLHETEVLRDQNARTWLVRTVCQILKIKDWKAVDAECTGRKEYPEPRDFSRAKVPLMVQRSMPELAARGPRLNRVERTRGMRPTRATE